MRSATRDPSIRRDRRPIQTPRTLAQEQLKKHSLARSRLSTHYNNQWLKFFFQVSMFRDVVN